MNNHHHRQPQRGSAGFTLVELLVVVALLFVLMMMMRPAYAPERKAVATVCLNNLKQLTLAWTLYQQDHQSKLIHNWDGPSGSWALGSMSINSVGTYGANTNRLNLVDTNWVQLTGPLPRGSNVVLGPYLGGNATAFRCPADQSKHFGTELRRVRSVSMNSAVGNNVREIVSETGTTNQVYRRMADIGLPSDLFLFTDEHPDNINDGSFSVPHLDWAKPEAWKFADFPAPYHNAGSTFSFTDGHVELHKWVDGRTRLPMSYSRPLPSSSSDSPNNQDAFWLSSHAAPTK